MISLQECNFWTGGLAYNRMRIREDIVEEQIQ